MQLLFDNFEVISNTPNGVNKLRELILQLAVMGKLVPQDPNDEPASALMEKIKTKREQLIRDGLIKGDNEVLPISQDELPFELPEKWEWVKLKQLSSKIHYGYTASATQNKKQYRLLRITDIQNDKVNWMSVPGCDITDTDAHKFLLNENDILIARTGGTIGKSYIVKNINVKAVFASYLIRIIPSVHIDSSYIKTFFGSKLYWSQLYKKSMGTGQPNVNGISLSNLLVPLPPINEQKSIVAKVDQLMLLCDELEKQHNKRDQEKVALSKAALNKMLTVKEPQEFQTHWQRIADNFDLLYNNPENVKELKQAILQLAVMGKLVPQDPNDEPASKLLKRINEKRKKPINEGKYKKEKLLPPINKEESQRILPLGWEICHLGDLITISSGDGLTSFQMNKNGNIPVYGGNGITGYHDKFNISKSTIVIGRVGFYCGSIHLTEKYAWVTDNAFITNYSESDIYRDYLIYLLKAVDLKQNERSTAQPVISGRKVYPITVFIAPYEEQKRIVTKVDQLMLICDELEKYLIKSDRDAEMLMNALVHEISNYN